MKAFVRSAALAIAGLLALAPAGSSMAQDRPIHAPAAGDEVVVYTHRFNAKDFEQGAKIVEEEFTAAQSRMGQTRLNYFLVNPERHDVVVVSFFGKDESVDEWHEYMGRLDVLDRLAPLRREPLAFERYQVRAVTETE